MLLNRDRDLGKKHWSSTALAMLAVVAVAGIAAGAIWLFSMEPSVATAPAPAIPVELAKPQIADVPLYLDGLGTVEGFNTVNVRTRVDGELQKILFTEGQSVKKGDLLAVVDPRPFQDALDEAAAKVQQDQANIANAQYLFTKDQSLAKQNIVTQEALEAQQSTVAGLMAQLAQDQAANKTPPSPSHTRISARRSMAGLEFARSTRVTRFTQPTPTASSPSPRPSPSRLSRRCPKTNCRRYVRRCRPALSR